MTPPRSRRRLLLLATPFVVLLLCAGAWLGLRGLTVARELGTARAELSSLEPTMRGTLSARQGTVALDQSGQQSLLRRVEVIRKHTAAAHRATDDPLWRLAAHLPYAGSNFAAVSAIAEAADAVASQALPALARSAAGLSAARLKPLRGGLPVAAIQQLGRSAGRAGELAKTAQLALAGTDSAGLLPQVSSARSQVLAGLSTVQVALQPVAAAAALAGPLLGASGRRTYFVGFVNPAEARGGGGLLGGFAVVSADKGVVTVSRIGSDVDLPNLQRTPAGLPAELVENYGAYGATTDWDESNLSAHFPYTGRLWAAMYCALTGTHIDGVLSLDPSALAVLLDGAQPISVGAGARVTAGNVVSFIQRDEYALPMTSTQRKDVLRSVARVAVDRLTGQPGSALLALLPGLDAAAQGGHIRFWSASEPAQSVIARFPVGGVVPSGAGPFLSVFVNNAASGKLDSYLALTATYAVRTCTVPGANRSRVVDVTVVLDNRAPTSGLPPYVTVRGDGDGSGPAPVRGSNRSLVQVMLSGGAQVSASTLDGRALGAAFGSAAPSLTETTERGHPVESIFIGENPGARSTLVLRVTEPATAAPVTLLPQPMAILQSLRATTAC